MSSKAVFICPGTHDKPPPHDCSPETVAAIQNVMRAKPTASVVVGTASAKTAISGIEPPPEPPSDIPQDVASLVDMLKGKTVRTVVHCRYCATDSVFESEMLAEAQNAQGPEPARVNLNLPCGYEPHGCWSCVPVCADLENRYAS